jgi:hypothetical protein
MKFVVPLGSESCWHLTAILCCLAFAAPLEAQQYSFQYFGTEDGLTNLAVKVLFQDRTGFIRAGSPIQMRRRGYSVSLQLKHTEDI